MTKRSFFHTHLLQYPLLAIFACCLNVVLSSAVLGGFIGGPTDLEKLPHPAATEAEIYHDWLLQDLAWSAENGQLIVTPESLVHTIFTDKAPGTQRAECERALVQKVIDEIKARDEGTHATQAEKFQNELNALASEAEQGKAPGTDSRWNALYRRIASVRRALRLAVACERVPRLVFTKHHNLGGSHYAYTDAVSDAQAERTFNPDSQLYLLEMKPNGECVETLLLDDPWGVIRDPEMSWDEKSVLFAWKRSDRLDDFHIYRMNLQTREITQLTFGLGYADYEPCELPSGDIIFNSTRCSQVVDCWWTEVANLYRMDATGRFMRRMTFDQVHDNYPVWTQDGRIIYTRWDYNDRGQIFPQGLFQMNPDGTGQTALYGNNSWFPTTILHARSIPDTNGKLLCIFSGHHTWQRGKLGVLDPNKGREENAGATLTAPFRETEAVHIDAYGQDGEQFCYPSPVTEREFFVAYRPNEEGNQNVRMPFSIYFMDLDGHRELIVRDSWRSCNQTTFRLASMKERAQERPSHVVPQEETGVYYLQDVFYGPGLEGVPREAIRSLRVVELGFRNVGIGSNGNGGPAGGAMVSTPVSVGGGTWDTKKVLGEAKIYEDGSACFRVPARTPLYFQVIDKNGHVVQTMRSWSTLQPGETFSCVGCHEDKNTIAARGSSSLAMKAGPQELTPFYGDARWFSFQKEVQPILNKHCIKCHDNSNVMPTFNKKAAGKLRISKTMLKPLLPIFSTWSYVTEYPNGKPPVDWTRMYPLADGGKMGPAPFGLVMKPPFPFPKDAEGRDIITPWDTMEIWMTTELNLPEDYKAKNLYMQFFHDEDIEIYINGINVFTEARFLTNYQIRQLRQNPLKPGRNVIAVHCVDIGGTHGVDVGIYELNETLANSVVSSQDFDVAKPETHPFSLLDRPYEDANAKRFWSESYMNLTNAPFEPRTTGKKSDIVQWINVQESPVMLKPYTSGAAQSWLCFMFEGETPHQGILLTQEEKDKIACWIDLLVPFCDTYTTGAAWDKVDHNRYAYYMAKKDIADAQDAVNYDAWARETDGNETLSNRDNAYRNLMPEMMQELRKAPNDNAQTLRFHTNTPIQVDQVRVSLPTDATEKADVEVRFGGHTERVTLIPERRGGAVQNNKQTVKEVFITGRDVTMLNIEIYGIEQQ